MGLIFAYTALITIVGAYEEKGISYEDIVKINDRTFRAKITEHWEYLEPNTLNWSENGIEKRENLYFLTPNFKKANKENLPDWKKDLEEMLKNQ